MTNIVERKRPLKTSQVNLTNHGFERFLKRVGTSKKREHALDWVTRALNSGSYSRTQEDGCVEYKYKEFSVIVDKNLNVVTIKSIEDEGWESIKETQTDITRYISNKLKKEAHPLTQSKKKLLIEVHEAKVRQIRARSPKVKSIIQDKIEELERDINLIDDKLEGIEKKARKYYLDPTDVIKEVL